MSQKQQTRKQYAFTERIEYSKLTPSSKKAYSSKLIQLEASGLTIAEALKLSDNELRNRLGSKAKDMSAYKRIYRQLRGTDERREKTIDKSVKAYKSIGYSGVSLDNKKKELVKASGNTFTVLRDIYQKKLNLTEKEAERFTGKLLKIPKSKRKRFKDYIKSPLDDYSPKGI